MVGVQMQRAALLTGRRYRPLGFGEPADDMHAGTLLYDLRDLRGMSIAPDIDVEPESTGLLQTALAVLAVFVEEHPKLGDLPFLAADHDRLQERLVTHISGSTKLVRHCYPPLVD
jgi:hypothetical protein